MHSLKLYFIRRIIAVCILVFGALIHCRSQSAFEAISLDEALVKAQKQNKIVLIQVAAKDCDMCNQVFRTAFEKATLKQKTTSDCICILVSADQKLWKTMQKAYNTREGGVTLFVDEKGTLIHRYNGTSSNADIYVENINRAKAKLGNAGIYRNMEKSYQDGKRNAELMEAFLVQRNNLGLEIDSLLDEYALSLPVDSAKSRRPLSFIARLAPVLGSPADKVLRKNVSLFNQVWLSLEQQERVAINNNIIRKSKQIAVANRDINAAYRVATFAGSTHYDVNTAQRAYDQNMIDFFRETRDTVQYLQYATAFYDDYLMTISVDSIKKIDSLKMRQAAANMQGDTLRSGANAFAVRKSITFSPSTQMYANQLTIAARTLYGFTKDFTYLQKALEWIKRADEFYESPAAIDLYARLLFRLGKSDEAIALEQKAIETGKKREYPVKEWEDVLKKMKKGEKNID